MQSTLREMKPGDSLDLRLRNPRRRRLAHYTAQELGLEHDHPKRRRACEVPVERGVHRYRRPTCSCSHQLFDCHLICPYLQAAHETCAFPHIMDPGYKLSSVDAWHRCFHVLPRVSTKGAWAVATLFSSHPKGPLGSTQKGVRSPNVRQERPRARVLPRAGGKDLRARLSCEASRRSQTLMSCCGHPRGRGCRGTTTDTCRSSLRGNCARQIGGVLPAWERHQA